MRAMIANGIVASAIAGRIRCRVGVDQHNRIPRDDRVEDVEVGQELEQTVQGGSVLGGPPKDFIERDRPHARRQPSRGGKPEGRAFQHQTKEVGQHQAKPEDRHRHADVGPHHRNHVRCRIVTHGGDYARRDPNHYRNQQRRHTELDRRRQPLDEHEGYRPLIADRVSKVPPQDIAKEDPQLDKDRLVETVASDEPRTGYGIGMLTQQCRTRIPRHDARQGKGEQQNTEQYWDGRQQSADDGLDHGGQIPICGSPCPALHKNSAGWPTLYAIPRCFVGHTASILRRRSTPERGR